jgi:2-polyprenyl-6-methoxyphenol hydroxylase-like FAD-dependent oxidoreductase
VAVTEASHSGVVVVGAGPTGLVAACELARRGVAIRVIDKLPVPTTQSRAVVVHARSLEMFDQLGLAAQIIGANGGPSRRLVIEAMTGV